MPLRQARNPFAWLVGPRGSMRCERAQKHLTLLASTADKRDVTSASGYELAPLGRRAGAWLFDAALGLVLAVGFVKVAGGTRDVSTLWHLVAFKSVNGQTGHQLSAAMNPATAGLAALKPIAGLIVILCVIAAAGVGYRVVTTAIWGAGIGKTILGLKVVVDTHDEFATAAPGWARSWKRWAVPQAPGLIPLPATGLLAFLPALRDSQRRGLHDRAAGTIVVDVRSTQSGPQQPAQQLASSDEFYVSAAEVSARAG
jgi:uncharacterized RDD family membrane protein YckC